MTALVVRIRWDYTPTGLSTIPSTSSDTPWWVAIDVRLVLAFDSATNMQGGQTIIKLQWLLATGFFGRRYHPDMILSINTGTWVRWSVTVVTSSCGCVVSAPFRGTQLVYALGEETQHAPRVRPFSAGDLLAKGVHMAAYLSPILPSFLDPRVDSRKLSFKDASFTSLLRQLWKSDLAESRDAAPYDVTFDAASDRESMDEGAVNMNTYYRSYCATLVRNHRP